MAREDLGPDRGESVGSRHQDVVAFDCVLTLMVSGGRALIRGVTRSDLLFLGKLAVSIHNDSPVTPTWYSHPWGVPTGVPGLVRVTSRIRQK